MKRPEREAFGVPRRLILSYLIPVVGLALAIGGCFSAPDDAGPWTVLILSFVVGAALSAVALWLAAMKKLPTWGGAALSSAGGLGYVAYVTTRSDVVMQIGMFAAISGFCFVGLTGLIIEVRSRDGGGRGIST